MKFSIRDLFLVTVIVALVLGWWVDHWKLSHELVTANKWRNVTGALERVLEDLGYKSRWYPETGDIKVQSQREGGKTYTMTLRWYEPTDALSDVSDSLTHIPNPPKK
jgi:hypothetical protein